MPKCSSSWLAANLLIFAAAARAGCDAPQIALYDNQVWLLRGGNLSRLTADARPKTSAHLSPAADKILFIAGCQKIPCEPSAVEIIDLEGRELMSIQPRFGTDKTTCSQLLASDWVDANTISGTCHLNPSLNEYVETDLNTGANRKDLYGFDFVLSPDRQVVAHAGWIPHFSPPYAHSFYLQLGRVTIYPLPQETKPVLQKDLEPPPQTYKFDGNTYSGLHDFASAPAWSPDGEHIGLVDCTYSWTPNRPSSLSDADGVFSDSKCALIALDRQGNVLSLDLGEPKLADQLTLQWIGPKQLSVSGGKFADRNLVLP